MLILVILWRQWFHKNWPRKRFYQPDTENLIIRIIFHIIRSSYVSKWKWKYMCLHLKCGTLYMFTQRFLVGTIQYSQLWLYSKTIKINVLDKLRPHPKYKMNSIYLIKSVIYKLKLIISIKYIMSYWRGILKFKVIVF